MGSRGIAKGVGTLRRLPMDETIDGESLIGVVTEEVVTTSSFRLLLVGSDWLDMVIYSNTLKKYGKRGIQSFKIK